MATNFPASAVDDLDGNQRWVDGITIVTASPLNNIQDAIDALQAKVGVNGSAVQSSIDFFMRKNYVKVSDQKVNAIGGVFYSGAWRTRDINTEDNDEGGLCALSSNQITLEAGTYRCRISCPAYKVNSHAARLYNVTADALVLMGTAEYSGSSSYVQSRSFISGQFTVAASQSLEVQHYCTESDGYGFGQKAFSSSTPNVYTVAEFWKLY